MFTSLYFYFHQSCLFPFISWIVQILNMFYHFLISGKRQYLLSNLQSFIIIFYMFALRFAKNFSKVKPLKCVAVTTDKGIKFTSQTDSHSFEITNALQTMLGSLAACQVAALKALTREGKLKVNKVNFKKLQSSYNLEKFPKGGKENHIDEVTLEAELETNGTQQEVDELHKKVQNSCPMYCMMTAAGIKINSTWKNVGSSK